MKASLLSTSPQTDVSRELCWAISIKSQAERKCEGNLRNSIWPEAAWPFCSPSSITEFENLLTKIEAAVKRAHSTSVEDHRAKLIAWITSRWLIWISLSRE